MATSNSSSTNLSAEKITQWKSNINVVITNRLIKSLKLINQYSTKLRDITDAKDDKNQYNLHYRFNDLAKVSETSASQLTTFMKRFNEDLDNYLKTIKNQESKTSEDTRKAIDKFAEVNAKISKLKM